MSGRVLVGVEALGRSIGERRAARRRAAIVRAIDDDFTGVTTRIEGDAVVLEGRGLEARWMRDARLRDVGRAER
jgi:hypothetical protein